MVIHVLWLGYWCSLSAAIFELHHESIRQTEEGQHGQI